MAKPNQASKVDMESMSTEERILYHYQHGQGSIQDIARVYRYSVEEVLHIIGQDEMLSVPVGGDLIDEEDIRKVPGFQLNHGTTVSNNFSLN